MPNLLVRALRSSLKLLKRRVNESQLLRTLLYDLKNREEFASPQEQEKMIADRVRVDSYHEAISRHVKPGDLVVDLGTGTGILAFFAAQQGARRVYAIDHSDVIELARAIGVANGLANIDFVRVNSRDFDPGEAVDVIVHEQIGDHLLNEGMVANLLDLKRRILNKGGIILPGRFELFLEPATLAEDHRIPFMWERPIHGLDFTVAKPWIAGRVATDPGYDRRFIPPAAVRRFLCDASPLLEIDLNGMDSAESIVRSHRLCRQVTRAGAMDGLCLYFSVIFDDRTRFDTSPFSARTHWGNILFRCERRHFEIGDEIRYEVHMEDLASLDSWAVTFGSASARPGRRGGA